MEASDEPVGALSPFTFTLQTLRYGRIELEYQLKAGLWSEEHRAIAQKSIVIDLLDQRAECCWDRNIHGTSMYGRAHHIQAMRTESY